MTKHTDVVEINGKRYDADSGKLLGAARSGAKPKKIKVVYTESSHDLKNVEKIHSRTSSSKTLMRHAVKKPSASRKIPVHHIRHKAHPSRTYQLKPHPARLERANKSSQHHLVSRFGNLVANSFISEAFNKTVADIPVRPEPSSNHIPQVRHQADKQDIFEKALSQADSHKQPRYKKPARHHHVSHRLGVSPGVLSLSSAIFAVVLLIGLVVYHNIPNIGIRLAAERAGVPAQMPDYQPAGFGLAGPIQYRPGQIVLNYKSNSDDRQFKINQRASAWDDTSLVENYLEPTSPKVQAVQSDGKTVYIYDEQNATWVSGGVWYQVEGDSSLNTDQLLRLAGSL